MENSCGINRSLEVGIFLWEKWCCIEYDIMAEHISRGFQLRDGNSPLNYVKIS